jgi:quercetin dioxygenase-like cupin family protein
MRYTVNTIKQLGGNMEQFIKNIEFSTPLVMETLVMYQEGQVVSRTLAQNKHMNMTLFAFDKNEEISSHASSGDAMVYILDGESEVTIGEAVFTVKAGETIVMPAGIPHALLAKERFKMMLIVVFKPVDVINF